MTSPVRSHIRKPLRARERDYVDAGLYFVTICVHHLETRFDSVGPIDVVLNDAGGDIASLWTAIPERHPAIPEPGHWTVQVVEHGGLQSWRTCR